MVTQHSVNTKRGYSPELCAKKSNGGGTNRTVRFHFSKRKLTYITFKTKLLAVVYHGSHRTLGCMAKLMVSRLNCSRFTWSRFLMKLRGCFENEDVALAIIFLFIRFMIENETLGLLTHKKE